MDRQLTKEEINSARRRLWLKAGVAVAVAVAAVCGVMMMTRDSIDSRKIAIATADSGPVETTVTASGKVGPAFEQIITSPISARILEVYARPGDSLAAGTPLMLLDLQSAQTELDKQHDQRQKQVYEIEQQQLDNETRLTNLEMSVRVKTMAVGRLKAEVANERRLDSIGSGTGDRVREAELAYRTAAIELEQLHKELANERRSREALLKSRRLDLSIFDKNLAEQQRTLDDARLRSPREATLTFINQNVGDQVAQGERVAVIADLSHFKIDAEIAESNARFVTAGGKALVRIARRISEGRIISVAPVSDNGSVSFSVTLGDGADSLLRPGLSVEVFVVKDIRPDVVRLPMGSYYTSGPGDYKLFVEEKPGVIVRRKVRLGESNYDYVEVLEGIEPGERVVVSDMSQRKASKYNLK